ncbi:rhomboid family intramembrane serine protease GlpG [Shimwellia blattae]|uniref:Rhomboid protease GlpG n=1 Tax=Shimwellia blattae (strain ATCC 29907 / DSM 4481 / JCM 1650 / NBRC 105725 / CDC 9005-74) TaxID=630626 RepID=I2B491_SHIBC|nr:rhomboid family intramembrane serine protease GlpG [Shimwellia blattae]AFJ45345.1 inner membrane-associated protein of glp regulon [Shimwellia blattae DSM 4481 = NBRC 105725]GAB80543.1 rhomboid protease GlpG [Shimwellia blattae DSM 4481 = NBRC 105725]VDY62826.1 Rhomboid protease glpG [Shimwellia blattae]VEC19707.1 Rhomboid protease glpG [Shimwellia blattae]
MLMITSFDNPRMAQAFVDYMATQGITLTIRHAGPRCDIWLADTSAQERTREELARFMANPHDPRYMAASWQTGHTGSGLQYRRYPFLATLRNKAGPFTLLIMAVCIVVWLLMQWVGNQQMMLWLAWPWDDSVRFELWRYFSHALLHFSVLHITFNLLWWWYLGGPLEKRLGSGKLFVITVISALLSGYVQHKFSGAWFGGLSGVVYALMGYCWLRGERDPECGIHMPRGLMAFAIVWLIAGWFDLFGLSIANAAHASGLAVGLAMAFADTLHVRKRT